MSIESLGEWMKHRQPDPISTHAHRGERIAEEGLHLLQGRIETQAITELLEVEAHMGKALEVEPLHRHRDGLQGGEDRAGSGIEGHEPERG